MILKLEHTVILILILINTSIWGKNSNLFNKQCLRCHSMPTFSYKDESSGLIKNLAVIPNDFYNSNHGTLKCIDCHSREFETFPHKTELKSESLYCLNCHKNKPKLLIFNFQEKELQFKQSVHYKKLGDKFTCFSCHDPHSFKINARVNDEIKRTVLYDNHICLKCHDNNTQIKILTGSVLPSLSTAHNWLPHKELHWAAVRCIDCHTPNENAGISHMILPKEKTLKNCVNCHSKNSILTQSLYKFQTKKARSKNGFLNAVILNNSYVIGATRNYYLNMLSFIIFGITVITIAFHAYYRWKTQMSSKNDSK